MIRVNIVADTLARAQAVATALSDLDRVEVLDAVPFGIERDLDHAGVTDVTVAIGLRRNEILRVRGPTVVIGDPPDLQPFGRNVKAWLPFSAPPAEIEAAIVAASNDLIVLTTEQSRRWLRAEPGGNEDVFVEALTQRELQVLRMLADGLANKEIAAELNISEHTAKFHVSQILAKLGVTTRAEAVAIGMRRGLVPI